MSRLRGELDGSTACRILEAVARAPEHIQEIVVDLGSVPTTGSFGLEVLARGIPASARGRRVRILGAPLVAISSGAAGHAPKAGRAAP